MADEAFVVSVGSWVTDFQLTTTNGSAKTSVTPSCLPRGPFCHEVLSSLPPQPPPVAHPGASFAGLGWQPSLSRDFAPDIPFLGTFKGF